MRSTTADLWDEVWAEYDARTSPPVARPRAAPAAVAWVAPQAASRGAVGWRWAAAGLLALGLAGYAAMPVLAAQRLTQGLSQDDSGALEAVVDWPAMQAGLGGQLAASAHALPPGRSAGLTPAGLDFLQGLAWEVTAGITSAEGLGALLRRRLGLEEGPARALARFQPLGLTRTRLLLSSSHGTEEPVAVTLALTDPLRLRWQVVALELEE